jgi:hypothetical protein
MCSSIRAFTISHPRCASKPWPRAGRSFASTLAVLHGRWSRPPASGFRWRARHRFLPISPLPCGSWRATRRFVEPWAPEVGNESLRILDGIDMRRQLANSIWMFAATPLPRHINNSASLPGRLAASARIALAAQRPSLSVRRRFFRASPTASCSLPAPTNYSQRLRCPAVRGVR